MSPVMSNKFIPIERDQPFVIPVQEWLTEDHLARFIVEIVEGLDVTALEAAYGGGGSAPYPPKMMLALLFYGYATGIFSSRALERATYELIPVIYITGNTHPDHNSINTETVSGGTEGSVCADSTAGLCTGGVAVRQREFGWEQGACQRQQT